MAHEVETMAWTNQVPWHGLGVQVANNLSTDQMLKAAGLDWTVSKRRLGYSDAVGSEDFIGNANENVVTGHHALVRDSDGKCFDVVGSEWTPVQNHEAFEFFREYVEAGDATMETVGSLRGGQMVWVLANLGKSFKLAGKDEVKGYLLMAQPHQQGKAQIIKGTSIRVVCMNTLGFALSAGVKVKGNKRPLGDESGNGSVGVLRRSHRGVFDEAAREKAKHQLGIAREGFKEFADFASKLSHTKTDTLRSAQLLAEIFGDDELMNEPAIEVIRREAGKATSYALQALSMAPGWALPSAQNTAWGVLNAVTYTTDHLLRRSADSRMFNAWFGRSEQIKTRAFDILGGL